MRYFSVPALDGEGDLSLTQKTQYLSESWLDTEEDGDWWRLGMKLIRCCKRREIEAIHELMKKVANYNHRGELPKVFAHWNHNSYEEPFNVIADEDPKHYVHNLTCSMATMLL